MRIGPQKAGARMEFTLGPWADGVNEKAEPGNLTATELRAAQNVLLDDVPGVVKKCYGDIEAATMPGGETAKYAYRGYKSDGTEYLLVSDGIKIYVTTDLDTFTELAAGLDSSAYLVFETLDNRCWISNGSDPTMWYDGTYFVVMDREYGAAETATTEAGTDITHIVDASLTQADDYWNRRKVVITSGAAAGQEGTVTDFDAATDKLTISGFTVDPGVGVTYMVGVVIPEGKAMRAADGVLFIGATSENQSEIRFNRLDDPDTGYAMSVDNPRAWPADYQLAITQDDGDQIWTFSPVYRDRVLVSKGTAIYRLERDATFKYKAVLISSEVGCRYPESWVVKDELLHFMGNERSGLLDLYITDMVSVKPRHKDGRFLPTFEDMRRSEPIYKSLARASADQFETGELSDTCKVSAGKIECKSFETDTDWAEIQDTLTDADQNHNALAIKGLPKWDANYNPLTSTGGAGDPNDLPAAASPAWTKVTSGPVAESVEGYGLYLSSATITGGISYNRSAALNGGKNTFATIRFLLGTAYTTGSGRPSMTIGLYNGAKYIRYCASYDQFFGNLLHRYTLGNYVAITAPAWYSALHVLNVLLDKDGNYKLWLDGELVDSGAASNSATNKVHFGLDLMETYDGGSDAYVEKMSYDADFSFTCAEMPNTLPAAGTALVKLDYTRAPDSYGKFFATLSLNGGTVGIKTQSSDDDVTYSALAALTNGQEPGVDNATPLKRYLKIEFTMTRDNVSRGPTVDKLTGGALWRMQAQQIGQNITAWRKWLSETLAPAGTAIVMKVRVAKTIATPAEGDFEAWAAITDGQSLATIMSDVIPVTGVPASEGRWIDAKVELNPSSAGVTPELENFLINWQEGTLTLLNLTAFMYRKRLHLTGTSRTAQVNDIQMVLDTQQAWTKFVGRGLNRIFAFKGLAYGLGSADEHIYQLDVEGNFNHGDTPIDGYIETGALDFGNQQFEVTNVKIGSVGVTSTIYLYMSYDGTTWTLIGSKAFSGDEFYNMRVPHGRIGRRHFIKLSCPAQENMGLTPIKVSGRFLGEQ